MIVIRILSTSIQESTCSMQVMDITADTVHAQDVGQCQVG